MEGRTRKEGGRKGSGGRGRMWERERGEEGERKGNGGTRESGKEGEREGNEILGVEAGRLKTKDLRTFFFVPVSSFLTLF